MIIFDLVIWMLNDFKGSTVALCRNDLVSLTLGKRNYFVQRGQCCSNIICRGMWNIIWGPSLAWWLHLQSNKSNKEFVQLNCSEIHSRSERKITNQLAMDVYRWKTAFKLINVNMEHIVLFKYTLSPLILFIDVI